MHLPSSPNSWDRSLAFSWRRSLSYGNQSIDWLCISMTGLCVNSSTARNVRSSCLEVFYEKALSKNFIKLTWNGVLFWVKFQVFACNFTKNRTPLKVFQCKFCEVLRTAFCRIPVDFFWFLELSPSSRHCISKVTIKQPLGQLFKLNTKVARQTSADIGLLLLAVG